MAQVTTCYATVVECVGNMQPCFVWIFFVHFSGSQHLFSFVCYISISIFLLLSVDLIIAGLIWLDPRIIPNSVRILC